MWVAGFSNNNLSLMALAVSVGFVVDDAIVMIENMYRNLEDGMKPYQAALLGAKQIGFTVLSISISLVAAFTPLIFMDGIVGRLFREFSLTLTFAILVSMVVSLTVTPMICAHYIKSAISPDATWFDRLIEGGLTRIVRLYERTLHVVLRLPILTMLVFFATIALTVTLYVKTPKGYFPTDDSGLIISVMDQGLPRRVMDIVLADSAVAGVGSSLGGSGGPGGGSNTGRMFISLKDLEGRGGLTTTQVIDRLRRNLGQVPGIRLFMFAAQDLRAGGRQSDSNYQYTLISSDLDLLAKWAPIVAKKFESVDGITDISSDRNVAGLALNLSLDRKTAASLGVQVTDIDNALNNAFSQRQVSIIYTQRNQYQVILEVDPRLQGDPSALDSIYVAGNGASQVPLSAVVHMERGLSPLSVFHQSSFPSNTISFNVPDGVPLQTATGNILRAVEELHMPEGIRGEFAGNAADSQKTASKQPLLILGALIAVYIVLGVLYESLAHPLTIISTLPSAGLGALLALQATNTPLTVIAFIGIILLIGIVKKNGIMIVDFALEGERQRGLSSEDAIFEACIARFRPILMTTMAALLAPVPLVLATGPGTELRRPLGITIIGGLIVSQILTLYTTPVIYLLIDRLRGRDRPVTVTGGAPAE